jgi:hypothetical protein
MSGQYKPLLNRIRRYFRAYGGWTAVVLSPFFLFSLVVSGLSYSVWSKPSWVSTAQSLLPNLLGFSLGTYSILFSLLTNRVRSAMKRMINERGISRLEETNATFFHFIFVQVIALAWSFIFSGSALADLLTLAGKSWPGALSLLWWLTGIGAYLGYTLLIYSFVLILGAALSVYRLALITDPAAQS